MFVPIVKLKTTSLNMKCQSLLISSFFAISRFRHTKSHVLEGCVMVLATEDCPYACSYSECVYIQITRYLFSQFKIPEA